MKAKTIAVIIKAEDDKIYQVSLTEEEKKPIINLILQLHENKIKVLPESIETIDIVDNKTQKS